MKKKTLKYTCEDPAKTFSKLSAKRPAVSLGLTENYTSSIRQTFVGRSEIIGASLSCMAPIPYFKIK